MKRFIAIAGAAFLTAGLIGWAALAWGQPSPMPMNDAPAEMPGISQPMSPAQPVEAPVRSAPASPAPVDPHPIPASVRVEAKKPPVAPILPPAAPALPPAAPVGKMPFEMPAATPTPQGPAAGTTPTAPAPGPIPSAPLAPSRKEGTLKGPDPVTIPSPVPPSDPPLAGTAEGSVAGSTTADREHLADSPVTTENRSGRQDPAISLEWVGSSSAKVGQSSTYSLVVRNACGIPVQQVLVRIRVPSGLHCMDTDPKAVVEGNVLVWELGTLQPRQEKNLQMKLLAEQKGDVSPQAWVTFTGSSVLRIKVREPKLEVKAKGPPKILAGETATFVLTVTNPGDGPAEQVKIHAVLSDGLESARGPKVDFDIGNLAAGETRNVAVQCLTKVGGPQKCEVIAEADGGLNARETAALSVTMPRLKLEMMGPGLRYLGRKALYTLAVSNPGDAPASNVTISDVVPDGFKVLAASDGGRHDASTRTVSWFLGEVGPGQNREVKLEVQAANPGEFKHKGSAVGARGLSATSDLTTRVEGLSALLLEMVDTDDPIEVSSDTAYQVRITNTGSKDESDIKLVATIPDKMEFKSATGPVRFHEEGKVIVFEPIEKLAPKAEASFRINVKASNAGTVRFKIQLTSTNLVEPVIKMEATRIYADDPEVKPSH
jgi:uncharacterized repeat protein (TIGR01451 family)